MPARAQLTVVRGLPPPRRNGELSCMPNSLLQRPVKRRPSEVLLKGRVLFLCDNADLVRRQLGGEDLSLQAAGKLRDNISTDEITPAYICYYFDETLGEFPYLGLRAGNEFPVTRWAVRRGGFVCSVGGK